MKRLLIVSISIFLVAFALSAQVVSQEIIPLSSVIYDDMDLLYLITGNGTPSNARPWTKSEAHLILNRVDSQQLDGKALQLYSTIEDKLETRRLVQTADGFSFDFGFNYNFEGYYHTNGDDFNQDTDWIYGFEERKPMVKFDFTFNLDPFFYTFTDLQYARNRFTDRDVLTTVNATNTPNGIGSIIGVDDGATISTHSHIYSQQWMTNVLYPTYDIDFQTPKRALVSFGGSQWNLNISRDKVKWGNGHSGNFIIDDHVDYQEFARFTGFSDAFKYDLLYVFFETNPHTGETSSADNAIRMLMAHRLEFRILDKITFAVSENLMYRNSILNLRHLNPGNIYHNLNNTSMFNAIAHVELDYSPFPRFNVYGQYVLDQAVAPNESDAQADATGYLFGVEYAIPLDFGILSTSLEFAQASPALYRRDRVDFLMFRRYHGNGTSFVSHIDYIGYQHGPDIQVLQWDANLRILPQTEIYLRALLSRQGEVDYFMSNSDVNDIRTAAPSGDDISERGVLTLGAKTELPKVVDWITTSAWFQLDVIGQRVHTLSSDSYSGEIQDVQLTFGVSLSL